MEDTVGQVIDAGLMGASVLPESEDIESLLVELGDAAVPPPKLYRIGEVVQYSGFSRQTVHNYTSMGLIRESQWTQTGHRLYDGEVFRYLAVIKHLKDRYTLAQIKRMLERVAG